MCWKIITTQTQAVSTKIKGKQGVKDFLEKKIEENRGLIWKNSKQFIMTLNVFGPGNFVDRGVFELKSTGKGVGFDTLSCRLWENALWIGDYSIICNPEKFLWSGDEFNFTELKNGSESRNSVSIYL